MAGVVIPQTALQRSIYRDSFAEFFQAYWETTSSEELIFNWHIEYICNEIQEVLERVFRGEKKLYDLIVNVPPGSSKSTIASILCTPWCWTRMPELQSINCSFDHPLALDLGLKSRLVIESDKYKEIFPDVVPSSVQWTKSYFKNTTGGYRFATSTQGGVTGRHGHVIITDDSMDPMGSYSDKELKGRNQWLTEVLSQRKVNKSVTPIITIQQRLHENDETGFRLSRKKLKVFHVCLPAEVSDNVKPPELKENYVDGLLDPVRLSEDVLAAAREELGAYGYAGQFDQSPTPLEGGMFEVDQIQRGSIPSIRKFAKVCRFWDKAATPGGGAYTVGFKMGYIVDPLHDTKQFWILDVIRVQLGTHTREALIKSTAESDGRSVIVGLEQEPGSGGKDSTNWTVWSLAGFVVEILKPSTEGDKERRAVPFSTQMNNGNVWVPNGVEWFDQLYQEFKFFPASKYKDQVDGGSGCFITLTRKKKRAGLL